MRALSLPRVPLRAWPVLTVGNVVLWTVFHTLPVFLGVLVGRTFDALGSHDTSAAWNAVAIVGAIAVARIVVFGSGIAVYSDWWHRQVLLLRRNLLRWLLTAPGSRRVPLRPGAAVSTFRDDVDDVSHYLENWIDLFGLLVYVGFAVWIMGRIDVPMTLAATLPSVAALAATRLLAPAITRRREEARRRTEEVTGFLGEHFSAIVAVKANHRERSMLAHYRELNDRRAVAGVRDTVIKELVSSLNLNVANLAMGLVLLLGASRLSDGAVSVGDLTVFLFTIPMFTHYLAWGGEMLAHHSRAEVSVGRLEELAVDGGDDQVFATDPLALHMDPRVFPPLELKPGQRLLALRVVGLTARHPVAPNNGNGNPAPTSRPSEIGNQGAIPDGGRGGRDRIGGSGGGSGDDEPGYTDGDGGPGGIVDVSFTLQRGSFTVVTGRIGSGKSTLLRALLGLIPLDAGQIWWNDELVRDPARFLTPPRSAYTPQVPKLVSDTLAANISMGRRLSEEQLQRAIDLAVMTPDLVRLESGFDTLVGSRGVRLSGGQVQRSAAARMFATDAELLVFDDLSSALDVRTEARLWDGLFASREATCLVVSHRRPALRRADQILLMDAGRLVDTGTLDELLERSRLMAAMWDSDLSSSWER